jgi:segregation and condensation protein B
VSPTETQDKRSEGSHAPPESAVPDTIEEEEAKTESDIPVAEVVGEADETTAGEDAGAEAEGEDGEEAMVISRAHLRGLLEALIFASDKPMKTGELARLASARLLEVRDLLGELQTEYAQRGIVLGEVAGGWIFRTSAKYAPFVRDLAGEKPVRLTRAQVETLAIAAYRQPITRPEIDDIRGVDSGATLKLLLERDLLRILGKKDEPGRPILYGTTSQFLEFFGLKSLKDLPTLKEFTELSEESRQVAEAELGDVLPHAAGPHDTIGPPAGGDRDTTEPPPPEEGEREEQEDAKTRSSEG